MRKEKDGLGERLLPDEAYYGIQTLRAMENFAISDNTFAHYPNIIRAMKHSRILPDKSSRISGA